MPDPKVRVHTFAISLDGYGAGPNQTKSEPLGEGGESLHDWFVPTRTFQRLIGKADGVTGIDDDYAARGIENIGAWILGRNMFSPIRGPWPDDSWRGWWGKNPPYHVPVFVLTNHARASVEMEGGTVFHFVTAGIEAALDRAREAAGARDIRIGGGVSTVRQYLTARLIDHLQVSISPILLGSGESLFTGIDLPRLGYEVTEFVPSEKATHVVFSKRT
jgi:dihydrofolate reductase